MCVLNDEAFHFPVQSTSLGPVWVYRFEKLAGVNFDRYDNFPKGRRLLDPLQILNPTTAEKVTSCALRFALNLSSLI